MKTPNQFIVENFRSWDGRHFVELQNMNLLFGPNSSGKSSIIHALCLLKQSKLGSFLISRSSRPDAIDLGRINDQINKKALSRQNKVSRDILKFGIKVNDLTSIYPETLTVQNRLRPKKVALDRLQAELDYLEYVEGYDENGIIASISLNCIYGSILSIKFTTKSNSHRFHAEVTDNEDIWNALLDLQQNHNSGLETDDVDRIHHLENQLVELENRKSYLSKTIRSMKNEAHSFVEIEGLMQDLEHVGLKEINIQEEISIIQNRRIKNTNSLKSKLRELTVEHNTYNKKRRHFSSVLTKYQDNLKSSIVSKEAKTTDFLNKEIRNTELQISDLDQKLWSLGASIDELKENLQSMQSYLVGTNVREKIYHLQKKLSFSSENNTNEALRVIENLSNITPSTSKKNNEKNILLETEKTILQLCKAPGTTPFNLLIMMSSKFKKIINSTKRLGPHRERPERLTFVEPNQPSRKIESAGQNVMQTLNEFSEPEMVELNKWMNSLGISYIFDKRYHEEFGISQLVLTDKNKQTVSISDVGYGIGQVLPVVLTCMTSRKSLILIEQPELHLHPKLQANLADLFIKSSIERENIFILESHSEHIILRLKRLQRESEGRLMDEQKFKKATRPRRIQASKLAPNWKNVSNSIVISVVELNGDTLCSSLTPVSLNASGDFNTIWPGEFFPERFIELGFE